MQKDFSAETYIVDHSMADTIAWLLQHQDSYDAFHYDAIDKTLMVEHANGRDEIREGDYLNARYGILITAHNFARG